MIKQHTLNALQLAMNQALQWDELSEGKIRALDGRLLEIKIMPLGVRFFMTFQAGRVVLKSHEEKEADTVIESSPMGLIRLSFLPASKVRSLFNDQIKISGDAVLGQQIKNLFDDLHLDWEGHLAHFTGDVVAHQLGSVVRRGLAYQKELRTSLKEQVSEYLHEESGVSVSKEALCDFCDEVDEVALAVERLNAKINWLRDNHEVN